MKVRESVYRSDQGDLEERERGREREREHLWEWVREVGVELEEGGALWRKETVFSLREFE